MTHPLSYSIEGGEEGSSLPPIAQPDALALSCERAEKALRRFDDLGLERVLAGRQGPGLLLSDLRAIIDGARHPPVLTADFAQAVLRPLAFRLQGRADAGENIAIGQGLRRDLEVAITMAADLLDGTVQQASKGGSELKGAIPSTEGGER